MSEEDQQWEKFCRGWVAKVLSDYPALPHALHGVMTGQYSKEEAEKLVMRGATNG